MSRHLREAMTLNDQRKPVYAALTGNKSVPVSEALVSFEQDLLMKAYFIDLLAFPMQIQNIPIACNDLMSMQDIPQFHTVFAHGLPKKENYLAIDAQIVKRSFSKALAQKDFERIVQISDAWLVQIEKESRFNCLMHHFLESIRHFAGSARYYEKLEAQRNISGADFLSMKLINGQIDALDEVARIDRLAESVHMMGVPIICQDVPRIPKANY